MEPATKLEAGQLADRGNKKKARRGQDATSQGCPESEKLGKGGGCIESYQSRGVLILTHCREGTPCPSDVSNSLCKNLAPSQGRNSLHGSSFQTNRLRNTLLRTRWRLASLLPIIGNAAASLETRVAPNPEGNGVKSTV